MHFRMLWYVEKPWQRQNTNFFDVIFRLYCYSVFNSSEDYQELNIAKSRVLVFKIAGSWGGFPMAALQIIFKISRSGWSESPQSYQIVGSQIKIFWLHYICHTWNFLWYQNYIYIIVILVFYILFCLIKRFINVKIKRLFVF